MITTTASATESVDRTVATRARDRAAAVHEHRRHSEHPARADAGDAAVPDAVASALAAAIAGAALLAGGAALVAHCIRLFIRLGRGTLAPWDPTRELVSVGAYRYSRNPMKGGLFLVLAGEAVLTGSSALAVWFVCFAIVNVVYIRLHEEPGLYARFGERYRDYCARVPRWWPTLASLRASDSTRSPQHDLDTRLPPPRSPPTRRTAPR